MISSLNELKCYFEKIQSEVNKLSLSLHDINITNKSRKILKNEIKYLTNSLKEINEKIDPIYKPTSIFDPGDPEVISHFVSIALVSQELVPLNNIKKFYGSGIYAIYYGGDYELYKPISKTETPIYIGKADSANIIAKNFEEQECRIERRLGDHRRNIIKAKTTIDVNDFYCRWLVVRSGLESSAESYLINLFKPIWNKEMGVIVGFGKHGDSAKTRANMRSPWDTLHPARVWAMDETLDDKKTITQIRDDVNKHFIANPPYQNKEDLLNQFFVTLRQ